MTHFSRIPSRVAGALLTGAVLCGTAACTTSGDHTAASGNINAAPVAAVQKAVDKGAKLNSVSYQLSGRVPGQGTVDGKVSFSMRPRAIDMRMKASGGKEEGEFSVRLVGDAVYLGGDGKATAALGGKHWIKFAMKDKGADALGGCSSRQTRTRRRRRPC
ncbi:hypothetical protein [Streptomyces sp. KS_16]|uniref:hypothetical protein n=1 Tax=Streptomyces sp. KS_16 TaxID=1855350 RepID=UPI000C4B24DA|nr:hypothetical protein [Streptomyces sp. KS_16]